MLILNDNDNNANTFTLSSLFIKIFLLYLLKTLELLLCIFINMF